MIYLFGIQSHFQGEQPHCGFPEKNFSLNVEKLARKVCPPSFYLSLKLKLPYIGLMYLADQPIILESLIN